MASPVWSLPLTKAVARTSLRMKVARDCPIDGTSLGQEKLARQIYEEIGVLPDLRDIRWREVDHDDGTQICTFEYRWWPRTSKALLNGSIFEPAPSVARGRGLPYTPLFAAALAGSMGREDPGHPTHPIVRRIEYAWDGWAPAEHAWLYSPRH